MEKFIESMKSAIRVLIKFRKVQSTQSRLKTLELNGLYGGSGAAGQHKINKSLINTLAGLQF
jgi:hypothetical protein